MPAFSIAAVGQTYTASAAPTPVAIANAQGNHVLIYNPGAATVFARVAPDAAQAATAACMPILAGEKMICDVGMYRFLSFYIATGTPSVSVFSGQFS
jgi:hypothetical protein